MKINTTKYKMIITIIVSFTLLTFLLITFTYKQVSKNIIDSKLEHLSSLQISKVNELYNWFGNLNKLLISLSDQKMTHDAFTNLQNGFYKLELEMKNDKDYYRAKLLSDLEDNYLSKVNYDLPSIQRKRQHEEYLPLSYNGLIAQYLYTLKNKTISLKTTYSKVHELYNNSYGKYLEAYNIYDIFMIDLEGNLIYTNIKEKDFATNLLHGAYKNSGLASIYKKALKVNYSEVVFEDFKPYEPSYNTSASFIATPIYIDGKKVGVFAFQISISYLNRIITFENNYEKVGLGKTGQSYLIGEDYKLRSDMRFLDKLTNESIYSSIGIKEVISPISKNIVLNKLNSGSFILDDYKNDEVISVFSKISMPNDVSWYILTEIQTSETLESTNKFKNEMILISFMIFGLIGIFIVYYVGRIMNVLSFKEKELEKSNYDLLSKNSLIESLMESIPIPIFYKDSNGEYKGVNKEFERLIGFSKEEIIGKNVFDIAPCELASTYHKYDLEIFKNPQMHQVYEYNMKNAGKSYDVVFHKKAFFDENGNIKGIIGAIIDITQKKKYEKELIEYSKKLKKLNNNLEKRVDEEVSKNLKKEMQLFESSKLAAMGSMIGNIIHQWKQPLNYISLVAAQLQLQAELKNKIELNEIKDNTQSIISAVKRLSEITLTFRNFLKEKKEMKNIILQDRIEECLIISGTILKDKNIELIKDIKSNDPIEIKTIPSELTEVIINIINNAMDAIVENGIDNGFVKVNLLKEIDYVTICIEDNGGGIPNEVIPNIFNEYFTTKCEEKGTGLGLYMSKKIVTQSLGGKLYAKNSENGVCFYIKLPLK